MTKYNFQKQINKLWFFLSYKRKKQFILLFILMIIASIMEVISIGAVFPFLGVLTSPEILLKNQYLRYFLNTENPKDLLLPLTIAFIFSILISGIFRFLLLWAQTRLSYAVGGDLTYDVYRKTLYQKYKVHISRNSSEIINGITGKTNTVVHYTIIPVISILSAFTMLLLILILLFTINLRLTLLIIISFSTIYSIIILISKKFITNYSKIINQESTNLLKALQEGLGGIREILLDNTQEIYCKIFKNSDVPSRKAQANIAIIGGGPKYGFEVLGMILIAGLAYSLTIKSNSLSTVIPVLGSLVMGFQRLLPILQQIYSNWTTIKGGQASLSDALELLDQPLLESNFVSVKPKLNFNRKIEFKDVSFGYNNSDYVVEKLNLIINKGDRVGIVGSTGSGKSTILDLIMGLLEPSDGKILIDDIVMSDTNCRSWQSNISHVPQVIYLSDSTIAENIAFGLPLSDIDFNKLELVAKQARIFDTIELLEKKFFTKVGERGVRLSGGQRQRIGIARALYKNASVIIFDEATSALDDKTETEVMEAIDELSKDLTLIIVAHRTSTLKNCNKIIEIRNSTIFESFTFNQNFK